MFKTLSLALMGSLLILLSGAANAATNAQEAAKEAAEKCKEGCLILSPEQVAALEFQVNLFARNAFEEGVKQGVEAAKDNPKICPKNI